MFVHSHSPEWGPGSYQHRALCLHVSLGRVLVLQGGLDDQLLLVISPASPVLLSLHSPPRTVIRKPAAGSAESPLLLEARAHTPLARGRKGSRFPRREGSALLAGCAEPEGWEGMAGREGQPPGVLLQLGKWEAPAGWPKENKPQTEQYTVCCLCDERPASLCLSAPRGVGQINVSPNSAEPKRTPVDLSETPSSLLPC